VRLELALERRRARDVEFPDEHDSSLPSLAFAGHVKHRHQFRAARYTALAPARAPPPPWLRRLCTLHRIEELAKRPAHDPRDLHLGDAEAAADLVLVQVLLEAQPEHPSLALVERRALGGELGLDSVIAGLRSADGLDHRPRLG